MLGELHKSQALQYLEQELLLNMGMIEPIHRDTADILYAQKDGVLLFEKKSGAYMISVDCPDLAQKLIKSITDAKLFAVHQSFCLPIIQSKFVFKNQFKCSQAVYLNKTLIPSDGKIKIYKLNHTHIPVILDNYHAMDDPDYITRLIESEQIYGTFVMGNLAGFIGMHPEGSIGMLEVLPDFRRQGIGYALESYMVNLMMKKGWIPFCQVFENNTNSIALQKKLGFELSNQYLYWLF
ncbi:GNAT family N-acetyltransferase [Aminipila terrae]|uniref:GNAT family N-acetyltransferase n=1 Tax=Aminipila terrae TaxID=2697030 RepID=A0A6P1MIH4_9FIRM|nr:GNAT family N-acetyltransferase [Aminipila terrae]QHI73541.1 GNAT family N-acetyltransferase [Aminipila terrae]